MKVKQNGAFIHIEKESDLREMKSLRCVCGHNLVSHAYGYAYGSDKTIEVKGCESCGCRQFKLKGKVEMRNYQYA